jgi:flagellar M-ring protein FliF
VSAARDFLSSIPTRGKVFLALSLAGIVLFTFFMLRLAGQPDYATLMSGVEPAQTGKLTAVLDERGIPYELQNNGTAIAVEKSRTAEARIALAEQGVAGSGEKPGWELMDSQKLGSSDFQQRVSYQRALEGEIARTLEQVDGVSGAQVQLVLPEEQLFEDESAPATAAVVLTGDSAGLDPSAVRGMAQLVSSSVKGLKPSNVSITDGTGALVWPKGDGTGEDGQGAPASKQVAEERYERALEGRLTAMLAQTIGPGKARVSVKADVDADKATEDRLVYERRGVPTKTTTETERLRGGGGSGGASGVAGNIPSYAQGQAGGANSNYQRETENTELAVGKRVIRTEKAPGATRRQDVALVLDKSVPAADVPELRRAVAAAAGIDTERGDTIAVSQFAFAKGPAAEDPGPIGGALEYGRYAALALALALFTLFLLRHLRRREQEALPAEPVWLREIESPQPIAELQAQQQAQPTIALPPTGDPLVEQTRRRVEELVNREPERVAQQVKMWMNED